MGLNVTEHEVGSVSDLVHKKNPKKSQISETCRTRELFIFLYVSICLHTIEFTHFHAANLVNFSGFYVGFHYNHKVQSVIPPYLSLKIKSTIFLLE